MSHPDVSINAVMPQSCIYIVSTYRYLDNISSSRGPEDRNKQAGATLAPIVFLELKPAPLSYEIYSVLIDHLSWAIATLSAPCSVSTSRPRRWAATSPIPVPTDYGISPSTHSCEPIELPAQSVKLADSCHRYGSYRLHSSNQSSHGSSSCCFYAMIAAC